MSDRLSRYLNESKNTATMKSDLKLKSGDVISKGTKVEWEFIKGKDSSYRLTDIKSGKSIMAGLERAHKYLPGFAKPPSIKALEKMSSDGIAKTVTGKRTELDGYGPDGSPSWMLVMGYI